MNTSVDVERFLAQTEQYKDELYRYAVRTLWDPSQADDVFSAMVASAFENYAKFKEGSNFRAWMYKILTNKIFVANRETGRRPRALEDVAEAKLVDLHQDQEYRDVLQAPELFLEQCGDEVAAAFKRLSPAERSCILLRSAEKRSYKDIAATLGMPVGTVMTHLARGRAKLRNELLDYAKETGVVKTAPALEKGIVDQEGQAIAEGM